EGGIRYFHVTGVQTCALPISLPAVFTFIKTSLIGYSMFGATIRTGIVAGLTGAVLAYLLSLVLIYVVALIINALAPSFGGQKNQIGRASCRESVEERAGDTSG